MAITKEAFSVPPRDHEDVTSQEYTKILHADWTVFLKDNKDNRRQKYPP